MQPPLQAMFRTVDNKNGQAQCGCICSLNCMMRSIFSECLSYKTPDHKLDDTSHPPGPLDDPPPDTSNNILDYFHMGTADGVRRECPQDIRLVPSPPLSFNNRFRLSAYYRAKPPSTATREGDIDIFAASTRLVLCAT